MGRIKKILKGGDITSDIKGLLGSVQESKIAGVTILVGEKEDNTVVVAISPKSTDAGDKSGSGVASGDTDGIPVVIAEPIDDKPSPSPKITTETSTGSSPDTPSPEPSPETSSVTSLETSFGSSDIPTPELSASSVPSTGTSPEPSPEPSTVTPPSDIPTPSETYSSTGGKSKRKNKKTKKNKKSKKTKKRKIKRG